MDRVKALWARIQRTPGWRAWQRYGDARGNLLAGGVTYFAFFSIFPAIALAFTIFGLVLQDQPGLLEEIKSYLNEVLPGFIQDGDNGLIPLEAPQSSTLSVTGAVGFLGLLWAGLGWLGALRDGIRAIFGVKGEPGNVVTNKLRDLGVLALLGLAIAVSATVTGVAGAAASWLADLLGIGGQGWVLKVASIAVGVVLDGAIVLLMLRVLSGVDVPWSGLRSGALVGGIGLTLLKALGTSLLGAMNNPLFASIALVVGLLVWLNFMSRVVLLASAWAANALDDTVAVPLTEGVQEKLVEGPLTEQDHAQVLAAAATENTTAEGRSAAAGEGVAPGSMAGPGTPLTTSQRAVDRVSAVSGAVAGAGMTLGAAALVTLWRGLRRTRR